MAAGAQARASDDIETRSCILSAMALRSRTFMAVVVVAGAGALALVAGEGCRPNTSVTQIWRSPLARAPMTKLIVFGAKMDEANRRALEDGFVAELAKRGVGALPSYSVFPGDPPEHEKAQAIVAENGFDGILVATLRSVRESQRYVPGHAGPFWSGYYGPGWGYAYSTPGYLVTDKTVTCETTLWDTRAQDQLVWAGLTETDNPGNGSGFVSSLTRAVLGHLDGAGFVPPKS